MSVLNKKQTGLKDLQISKDFVEKAEIKAKKRGRPKTTNKRDRTYTFYCTQEELDELEERANAKHLTMTEYFRIKLFAD